MIQGNTFFLGKVFHVAEKKSSLDPAVPSLCSLFFLITLLTIFIDNYSYIVTILIIL